PATGLAIRTAGARAGGAQSIPLFCRHAFSQDCRHVAASSDRNAAGGYALVAVLRASGREHLCAALGRAQLVLPACRSPRLAQLEAWAACCAVDCLFADTIHLSEHH